MPRHEICNPWTHCSISQNPNFTEVHTNTRTPLITRREKHVFEWRWVKDADINFSHSCTYMVQKINRLLFLFVFSKSSKRINAIHFTVLKPAFHISSLNAPESTSCQSGDESGVWQWMSFAESKLIQTALTPGRTKLSCASWYDSLCYKWKDLSLYRPIYNFLYVDDTS